MFEYVYFTDKDWGAFELKQRIFNDLAIEVEVEVERQDRASPTRIKIQSNIELTQTQLDNIKTIIG